MMIDAKEINATFPPVLQARTLSDELKNCDFIKTILMLAVVMCHCASVYSTSGWGPHTALEQSKIWGMFASWTGTFHIYGFTLVSGYIFYYLKYEKCVGEYQKYSSFITKKAKRLILPYIFIACIWVIPNYIFFYGVENIFRKYILGMEPSQLWFLLMLFWVFIIYYPISNLLTSRPVIGFVIVLLLYCIGLFAPGYFCFNRGLQYVLFFHIGVLIRKYNLGDKILYKIPIFVYIAINVILFILLEGIGIVDSDMILIRLIKVAIPVVLYTFSSVGVFAVMQRVAKNIGVENKIIKYFNKHSFVIYLIHQQLIYYSFGLINGKCHPTIIVVINLIFALLVSCIISMVFEKIKVFRKILW